MKAKFVHYVEVEPVAVAPGVQRRTLAWGERTMVMETTFEAGAELAMHAHPHEQVTYLVSGAVELRVGGEPFALSSGDSILVPGGVAHGGLARVRSVAIDAFSPPREDLK